MVSPAFTPITRLFFVHLRRLKIGKTKLLQKEDRFANADARTLHAVGPLAKPSVSNAATCNVIFARESIAGRELFIRSAQESRNGNHMDVAVGRPPTYTE